MTWPSFIISTTHHVLFLDDKAEKKICTSESRTECAYYGITWNDKDVFLSCVTGEFFKLDCNLNLSKLGFPVAIPHQILCCDNKVYITSPGIGSIVVYDIEKDTTYTKCVCSTKDDKEHINSIFRYENYFYVCHHNHSDTSFVSKLDLDLNLIEILKFDGNQCHNIFIENDLMYILNSRDVDIIEFDLKTKKSKRIHLEIHLDRKCFLRGLAASNDAFYIGASYQATRKDRDDCCSSIIEIDRNFNIVDKHKLDSMGQIREIRVIDRGIFHNGIRYPLNT